MVYSLGSLHDLFEQTVKMTTDALDMPFRRYFNTKGSKSMCGWHPTGTSSTYEVL